jgi:hypothetical protein
MAIPYWQQRREMKLKGKKTATEEKKEKQARGNFFERMIKAAPSRCMETGRPLAPTMAINPAAVVCHILAKSKKSGVPSMAENELNIVYLDGDVHTDMDHKGCDYIVKMKIFPLLRRRVVMMWQHIPDHEKRRVPECLKPGYDPETLLK